MEIKRCTFLALDKVSGQFHAPVSLPSERAPTPIHTSRKENILVPAGNHNLLIEKVNVQTTLHL